MSPPFERFPFDWKNPTGYSVVVLFQLVIAYFGLCFVAGLMCLAIGTFVIALTLTKDVRNDLNLINESVKSEQPLSNVLKQLTEFVRAHSHGKQLRKYTVQYCIKFQLLFVFDSVEHNIAWR